MTCFSLFFMIIDCQQDDFERNLTTLRVTLGREIVWFVSSLFRFIVVIKLSVLVVFLSIGLYE